MQKSYEIPTVIIGAKVEKGSGWWWDEPTPETRAAAMLNAAQALSREQTDRSDQSLIHLCLYENQRVDSLYAAGFGQGGWAVRGSIGHRATYNVVRSIVDTAANDLSQAKPHVTFQTSGGNWSMRRKAKQLKKFVNGMFRVLNMHEMQREICIDAGIFPFGAIKFWGEGEEIKAERVLPTELYADEGDAVYGRPQTIYQKKYVSRQALKKAFPKKAAAIDAAPSADPQTMAATRGRSDIVEVWESWHLPHVANSKDKDGKWSELVAGGRRIIAVGMDALVDEEWKKKRFPFYLFRWAKRRVGWDGQPLAAEVTGIQLEVNDLLRRVQLGHRRTAKPTTWIQAGSEVDELDSEVSGIRHYTGDRPVFETPTAFHPETYQHIERLIRFAFEQTGVSQMNAKAEKPAGVDAAVAIREIKNIASKRFATKQQTWEEGWVECAEIVLDIARDLYSDGVDVAVRTDDAKFIESIDWSSVDLPAEAITLDILSTNSLPDDPEGRLQSITELYKSGMITDRTEALRLLDFPDLEESLSLSLAALDEIGRIIESIEDDGKYEAPDPLINLEVAIKEAQASYLRGRTGGMPDKRLDLLLRFSEEAMALLAAAKPQPVAAMPQQAQIDPATGMPVVASVSAPVGTPAAAPMAMG